MFETKDDIKLEDLKMIQPALFVLFTRAVLYCNENKLPCRITSLISDRKDVKSVSRTHEQGRAVDISVKGWTQQHIHRFVFIMNRDYREIAAISASDGIPRAVIYHEYEGQGDHLHLRVRPNADVSKFMAN